MHSSMFWMMRRMSESSLPVTSIKTDSQGEEAERHALWRVDRLFACRIACEPEKAMAWSDHALRRVQVAGHGGVACGSSDLSWAGS